LLVRDALLLIFVFSLESLVVSDMRLDLLVGIADLFVLLSDFDSDALGLVLDFHALLLLVSILVSQNVEFTLKTRLDILLALKLSLIITLELSRTMLQGVSPSLEIFNGSHEACEVPVVELVGLDLVSVGLDDAVTDALAHLLNVELSLVLGLDLLVLVVFSLLPLLAMLLVVTERRMEVSTSRSRLGRLWLLLPLLPSNGRMRSKRRPIPRLLPVVKGADSTSFEFSG